MFGLVLWGAFFVVFCFVIGLFAAAVFVKNKAAQIILAILAFVLTITLILFLGIMDAAFSPNEEAYKKYVGHFENTERFLQLNENMTWEADTSFSCSEGTWSYSESLDYSSISLKGEWDSTKISVHIHNPDVDKLRINLEETTRYRDGMITFFRVDEE